MSKKILYICEEYQDALAEIARLRDDMSEIKRFSDSKGSDAQCYDETDRLAICYHLATKALESESE